MEQDHNDRSHLQVALDLYNGRGRAHREMGIRGQRVAYADGTRPDDTSLVTRSLTFQAATGQFLKDRSQDEPRFPPAFEMAKAVVGAMSALTGAAAPVVFVYPDYFSPSKASTGTRRRSSSRRSTRRR